MRIAGWRVTVPKTTDTAAALAVCNEEIARGLHTVTAEFERRVKLNTPVGAFGDGGGLRGAIHGEVVPGTPVRLGIVAHSSAYGDVIELGRKPGPVSEAGRESIELWARKKLRLSPLEAHWAAFAIAWKIRKQGFPGAHMFQRAFDEGQSALARIWATVGERIRERLR